MSSGCFWTAMGLVLYAIAVALTIAFPEAPRFVIWPACFVAGWAVGATSVAIRARADRWFRARSRARHVRELQRERSRRKAYR